MLNFLFGQSSKATTTTDVSEHQTEMQTPTIGEEDQYQSEDAPSTPKSPSKDTTTDSTSETNNSSNKPKHVFCHWHGDCSGSMQSMGDAGSKEGKNFCNEWRVFGKSNPETNTEISFYTFSAEGNLVYRGDPSTMTDHDIENCGRAMRPSSTTCLYDTAVPQAKKFLANINAAYNALPDEVKSSKTIKELIGSTFMLMTDGVDNMSNKYGSDDLKNIFAQLKQVGTTVCFAAANMDSISVGKDYGLDENTCLQMGSDPNSGQTALRSMTKAAIRTTTRSRSKDTEATDESYEVFTQAERFASCDPDEAAIYSKKSKKVSLF